MKTLVHCKGNRGKSKAHVTISVDLFAFGCKVPTVALNVWENRPGPTGGLEKKITHSFYASPDFIVAMHDACAKAIAAQAAHDAKLGKPLVEIL